MNTPPMPMTCHPSLEHVADGVRRMIDEGTWNIHIANPQPMAAVYDLTAAPTTDAASTATLLEVKKIVAPAPFVGDPRLEDMRYVWRAAIDKSGRHVASDSELVKGNRSF